ncbi:MAG: Smr/MutS family protein [Bacteroidaceae bacterium]
MIYPENFEKKIGFDEIRTQLKGRCLSSLGTEQIDLIHFLDKAEPIQEELQLIREFRSILEESDDFPSENFFDVRPSLFHIRLEGTYMEELELFHLMRSLSTITDITRFVQRGSDTDENEDFVPLYPALARLTKDTIAFTPIINKINQVLNHFGKIKDNASSELARIRQEMTSTIRGISINLNKIIRTAQKEGYIDKDIAPTLRDGRLVIPVAPALKRKIKGIIHDESATGKTVFIEPAEVVEANNRIRELEGAEKREIIRILKEITDFVRPHVEQMIPAYLFLGKIDCIRAKASWAIKTKSIEPLIEDRPLVDWAQAIHPLLQSSLQKHGKTMIPLDITLDTTQRIVLISGPNAGGKSVCLKTVGLLQYMLQCGISIPLRENSKTGVFNSLFLDIGDEQSLEDDLSTYSSHLLNMKNMMKHCSDKSLLLIDEFGGGTEPQIGGAMAEAILQRFINHNTYGVITTHYQNLKHFADGHEGIVNGAMLYDRHQMQALFQLQIGNPGSSFAIEIARKIGIPDDVIAEASTLVGSDYIQSDKYLQDIVRDKCYWENKRQNIHKREKQLEQTIARYETDINELQKQRKELIQKAKNEAINLLSESNAKIESTIKNIKEAQAEKTRTRVVRQELDHFRNEIEQMDAKSKEDRIAHKIEQLKQRKLRKEERKKQGTTKNTQETNTKDIHTPLQEQHFKVGDYVRIKGQTTVGKLQETDGQNALVIFGMMRAQIKENKLVHAHKPEQDATAISSYISKSTRDNIYEKKLQFKPEIDVRGMRGEEAIHAVKYFIDDAILLGVSKVRILHGTGSGILRTLLREYLHTVPNITAFYDEHIQFGGAGITVAEIQ